MSNVIEIRPHQGPQEDFLAAPEDIVIYGGGAGGGKTYALLLDFGRWAASVPGFTAVIFRRTYPEITNPGGLWDESMSLFPLLGGSPSRSDSRWSWPNGSWIKFSHLQHEDNVHSWQGAQLAAVAFDELTHFSQKPFFYMLSRLRSRCGVKPYLRATCNPDPRSWVAEFLSPWIDGDGFPYPDVGTRYMERRGVNIEWHDHEEDAALTSKARPLSVRFIPALVTDNPTLLADNPEYVDNLEALSLVDRARLLEGNWKVLAGGGSFFKREWFQWLPEKPTDVTRWMRSWDRAATEKSDDSPDPDWTAGVLLGKRRDGSTVIADVVRIRGTPGTVKALMRSTAEMDGRKVEILLSQDPGQAGVADLDNLTKSLGGFTVRKYRETGSKADRAKPLSSHAEAASVYLVRGAWNDDFVREAEAFLDEKEVKPPAGYHDDQVDAATGGYNELNPVGSLPFVRRIR